MPFLMPDVSSNNDPAGISLDDAKRIATVARALMVKATEGGTYTFAAFRTSEANARHAGLKTVAYHFVSVSSSGVTQARHLWSVVKDSGVSAVCVDWEAGTRHIALELLTELKSLAHGTGKRVGAYEGVWAREHGGGLPGCAFVIVPAYGSRELDSAYKLQPYAAWQYTDGHYNGTSMPSSIPGIGHCDVSRVDQPALIFGPPKPSAAELRRRARNAAGKAKAKAAKTKAAQAAKDFARASKDFAKAGRAGAAAKRHADRANRILTRLLACLKKWGM